MLDDLQGRPESKLETSEEIQKGVSQEEDRCEVGLEMEEAK